MRDISNKKTVIVLLLILVLGAFLRFYKLGELSFVADEFIDMNATYGYFKTGEWHAWDFNVGKPAERLNDPSDERAWIYKFQVAQLFRYLPPTEAVARSVSALWGVLTIVLMYLVGYSFTKSKYIGLLSAFLFAISVSGIIFDRRLRMYAMFFPVFLVFSWLVFSFLEKEYRGSAAWLKKASQRWGINLAYFIPLLAVGTLSLYLHQLTVMIGPIIFVYLLVQTIIIYKNKRTLNNKYAIGVGSIIFTATGALITVPQKVREFLGTMTFFNEHFNYISKALADYSHPLLAGIFLFAGAYYLIKKAGCSKEGWWLFVSFFTILLFAIFLWRRNVGPQYIFFAQSFEIILIVSGVYYLVTFLGEHLKKFRTKAWSVPLALSLLVLPNYGYFFEENNTYRATSQAGNPRYRQIFGYFKKHREPNEVLITRDFRNYYLSGENVETFDFGGERAESNFSLEELQTIITEHPRGWAIISDNDESFISKAARSYMEENFEKLNAIAVRGTVSVYRWGNRGEEARK